MVKLTGWRGSLLEFLLGLTQADDSVCGHASLSQFHYKSCVCGTRYHVSSSGYGKSCLECRRRKKKCDGTRPACLRCQRNVRTCVYEEGYIRTSITDRLEGRVQELEESFKSLNASFKEKISSHKLLERLEGGSPLTVTTTRPSSPVLPFFPVSSLGTEDNSDISRTGVVLSAPSEIGYASAVPRAFIEAKLRQFQQTGVMSAELLDYLIRVFLPFRGHYKFFLDIPAFFDDVRQGGPTTDQALKNAIYLAACQIAGSSSLQPYFLFELRGHLDFSQPPNGRPDGVVWASVILGNYFLRSYRLSEARSVVLSAARYAFERELYPQRASGSGSASAAAPSAPRSVDDANEIALWSALYLTDTLIVALSDVPSELPWQERIEGFSLGSTEEAILNHFPSLIPVALSVRQASILLNAKRTLRDNPGQDDDTALRQLLAPLKEAVNAPEWAVPISDARGIYFPEEYKPISPFIAVYRAMAATNVVLLNIDASDSQSYAAITTAAQELADIGEALIGRGSISAIQGSIEMMHSTFSTVQWLVKDACLHQNSTSMEEVGRHLTSAQVLQSLLDFLLHFTYLYPAWIPWMQPLHQLLKACAE